MARILDFIKGISFPNSKRLSLLIVLLGTIGVLVFALKMGQKIDLVPLYRDLPPEDLASVIEYLKQQKVPYSVDPISGEIRVPSDKVYQLRMELASKGFPSGGKVGFEIFDKTKLTLGEFVQKVNYRRALEGELARSIMKLEPVKDCRVHIVLPKDSPFIGERIKARASVMVDLKMGRKLSEEQVESIKYLVASAVEGLDPEDVSVVDSKGRLLSQRVKDPALVLASDQMTFQKQWEKALEDKITGLLEPIVGPGKVVARVSSEWDWRQTRQRQELFQAEPVTRSRQVIEETSGGTSLVGIPGVASNVPMGTRPQGIASGVGLPSATSARRSEIVNYEVGKSFIETVEPMGRLKRVSIAVIVDGKYRTVSQGGIQKAEFVPLPQEELQRIEEIVKNAVGIDPSRGDSLSVQCLPFTVPYEEVPLPPSGFPLDRVLWALKYMMPLLVAFLVIFGVLRPLLKGVTQREEMPTPLASPSQPIEEKKPEHLTLAETTLRLAKEDVDYAVGIIKKWMKEEKGGSGA